MSFKDIIETIRKDLSLNDEVPGFDPDNGNEKAKFLFLLEAPGPGAIETGIISFNNPDPSARNFKKQLSVAGVRKEDIAIWNVVPWYLGNTSKTAIRSAKSTDIEVALKYLNQIIATMQNLRCIVLVGGAARKSHIALSGITSASIFSCHHPSAKVINTNPHAERENIAVFKNMVKTFG